MRKLSAGAWAAVILTACAAGPAFAALPRPVWTGGAVTGDTLMFIREPGQAEATARLLFIPQATPALISSDAGTRYAAGRDYLWEPGTRTIRLPPGSRIPFRTRDEMYTPLGPNTFGPSRSRPQMSLFLAEDHIFHDLQVDAAYRTRERWPGALPLPAPLPGTRRLVSRRQPVRMTVLGDSISVGYSASAFARTPPFRQAYVEQVAQGLIGLGARSVDVTNLSVGGKRSAWGVEQTGAVNATQPDLVILAFGMNDAVDVTPEAYARNMRAMVEQIRAANPACEIVLVASMVGNADWGLLRPEAFPVFRDALLELQGPHVAVADVTSLTAEVVARKDFDDITGNGANHPNDFGHRLYAETILELIRRPARR